MERPSQNHDREPAEEDRKILIKLRSLVQDLSQHIERFSVWTQVSETYGYDGFTVEFSHLERDAAGDQADRIAARKFYNRMKNRYSNVLPNEDTRVILDSTGVVGSDYINANYIDGEAPNAERAYIATQGPLEGTVVDFWRMVWQTRSKIVIMLTRLREGDKTKCHRYYPRNKPESCIAEFGVFRVTLVSKEVRHLHHGSVFTHRQFILDNKEADEQRIVEHFQYTEWPDHGLPPDSASFRELLKNMDKIQGHEFVPKPPIIIHCSAGIGRTGTLCTVHSILRKLKYDLVHCHDAEFNICEMIVHTVLQLRKQRFGMVQTKDQYMFLYYTLLEALEEELAAFEQRLGIAPTPHHHPHPPADDPVQHAIISTPHISATNFLVHSASTPQHQHHAQHHASNSHHTGPAHHATSSHHTEAVDSRLAYTTHHTGGASEYLQHTHANAHAIASGPARHTSSASDHKHQTTAQASAHGGGADHASSQHNLNHTATTAAIEHALTEAQAELMQTDPEHVSPPEKPE